MYDCNDVVVSCGIRPDAAAEWTNYGDGVNYLCIGVYCMRCMIRMMHVLEM